MAADLSNPIHRLTQLLHLPPLENPSDKEPNSPKSPQNADPEKAGEFSPLPASPEDQSRLRADDVDRRRDVRTLPPWIHSLNQNENLGELSQASYCMPHVPKDTHRPHHPYVPTPKPGPEPGRGKLMDPGRSREPVTIGSPVALSAPRWQTFTRSAEPPRFPNENQTLADDAWLKENIGDLDSPWNAAGSEDQDRDETLWLLSNSKRAATIAEIRRILMNNAFVPLIIRITVLIFVLCALGIGVTIYQRSNKLNGSSALMSATGVHPGVTMDYLCEQQTSTYMAFIVDSFAVVYLIYITVDEYFSKPLGLRRSRDKVRLLFLDLIFIVFSAANTSLAFNTLTDAQWACYTQNSLGSNSGNEAAARSTCVYDSDLCARQRALCSMLVIALVAWFVTFAISVLRIVERITAR